MQDSTEPSTWGRIKSWWTTNRARYEKLVEEYGMIAVAVYLVLFGGTFFVIWLAIERGMDPAGTVGDAGTIGGAYVATRLTQPVRILATLVLTPALVRWVRRIRGTSAPESPPGG